MEQQKNKKIIHVFQTKKHILLAGLVALGALLVLPWGLGHKTVDFMSKASFLCGDVLDSGECEGYPACTWSGDPASCVHILCGNGVAEKSDPVIGGNGEPCDGADLRGYACATIPGAGFTGGDLSCQGDCSSFNTSLCTAPVCGDSSCDAGEDCSSCESDCGACGPVCGDFSCDGDESCDTCEADCGACGPVCGDLSCDAGEDCSSCESDCGACGPVCGNSVVEAGEDCDDGGESPSCNANCTSNVCGDGILNTTAGEQCDDSNASGGDGCSDTCQTEDFTPPTVTALGDGVSVYQLPSTCPSTACDRGDTYGAVLNFNKELDAGSKTAVENAITESASAALRTYVWSGTRVRIYATGPVSFYGDVVATVSDLIGNTAVNLLLIDSVPPVCGNSVIEPTETCDDGNTDAGDGCNDTCAAENPPETVYVDDDWTGFSNAGGHVWGFDAFSHIQNAIDAVTEEGTVNVAAGTYDEQPRINKTLVLKGNVGDESAGPGPEAPVINDTTCGGQTVNINANDVTIEGFSFTSGCDYPSIRVSNEISGARILDNEIANNYTAVGLAPNSTGATVMRNLLHDNSYGIVVGGSQNNTISGNDIYGNGSGIRFKCGIEGSECNSSGTVVSGNNIHENNPNGITFDTEIFASSTPILVQSNAIDSNACVGINIASDVSGVTISGNDIMNNGLECTRTGIYTLSVDQIAVHGNTISGNDDGIVSETSDVLDATRNYWGAANGPSGEGGGDGDTVSSFVAFAPYYKDADLTQLSDTTNVPVGDLNPVEIEVEEDDSDASLDVSDLITGLSGEIPEIAIAATTSVGEVHVDIPAGTTVTGDAGWTGVIHAPTVKANNTVAVSGGTVQKVIEIGFDDIALTFDKGVRILIAGAGGQLAGYSRGGVFTPINSTCAADNQATGDALAAGADCKITVGGDLVIWTKHFTSFVSYSPSAGGGAAPEANVGGGGGYRTVISAPLVNPNDLKKDLKKSVEKTVPALEAKGASLGDVLGHWAKTYIEDLTKKGIMAGKTKTQFAPDGQMTRAELVKIVILAFDIPVPTTISEKPFADVDVSASYAPYIQAAKAANVLAGSATTKFQPNNLATRADALSLLLNAAQIKLSSDTQINFKDTNPSAWYAKYLAFAVENGIVIGYGDGTFHPVKPVTRAEVAKMTVKIMALKQ